tara:strand:+ start:49812 stop:50249 length:438 start_codon:yes stop_codon:yes gene_type:complete
MKEVKKDIFEVEVELEPYEQELKDSFENAEPMIGDEFEKMKSILEEGAANYLKKDKTISLRLTSRDVHELKKRADEEGIPYQTLITSVLRKYLSDELIEKKQLQQILQMQADIAAEKPKPKKKPVKKPISKTRATASHHQPRKAA